MKHGLDDRFISYDQENGKVDINISKEEQLLSNLENTYKVIYIYGINEIKDEKVDLKLSVYEKIENEEETKVENNIQVDLQQIGENISVSGKITNEIYKGYMYSLGDKETTYNEKYSIEISNKDNVEKLEISNDKEVYTKYDKYIDSKTGEEKEKVTEYDSKNNIFYKQIVLNKNNMLEMLGESGKVIIKNDKDEIIAEFTKDSEANEQGNITYDFAENNTNKIKIETTKPEKIGNFDIYAKRVISTNMGYTKDEISNFKYIEETIKANSSLTNLKMSLVEPTSDAKLEVSKDTFTTNVENKEVEFKVTLISNKNSNKLYKNPIIKITLPEDVQNIELTENPILLYEDELEIVGYKIEGRDIILVLEGEETKYKPDAIEGAVISIKANVTLNKLATNKDAKILTQIENNGEVINKENNIKVFSPREIITVNNINELGIETIGEEEKVEKDIKGQSKEITISSEVINNNEGKIEDVKIVGDMPTDKKVTENEKTIVNNLGVQVTGKVEVTGRENKVYYTENESATDDLTNQENGWTEDTTNISNMSKYMVVVDELEKDEKLNIQYKAQIPENIEYNKQAYTGYQVLYSNNDTEENKIDSTYINLNTGKGPVLEATLSATVGKENIENGATVRKGEVIRYRIDVTNTGTEDATDVKVTANIPEGTVYVEPLDDYIYNEDNKYYEEIEKQTEEQTISDIKVGETKTIEYEVRVKEDAIIGNSLSTKATINYGEATINTQQVDYIIEDAKLRVTFKRVSDLSNILRPLYPVRYLVTVENISEEIQEDVNIRLNTDDLLDVVGLEILENENLETIEVANEINIGTIGIGEEKSLRIMGNINDFSETEEILENAAIVEDSNGNIYKSNVYNDTAYGYTINFDFSADNENGYIKTDDTVNYNLKITNNSKTDTTLADISLLIPDELTIKSIEENGENIELPEDNNISLSKASIKEGETIEIKVQAIVNFSQARNEDEEITTIAELDIGGEIFGYKEINHIIEKEENAETPIDPTDPDNPDDPDNPENPEDGYRISGLAWLDENKDGQMQDEEQKLTGIRVSLLDVNTNELVTNDNGEIKYSTTDGSGSYNFTGLKKRTYIVLFEYDTNSYTLTTYKKDGVSDTRNSDVVSKKISVNNLEKTYAVTDNIEISDKSIGNISIGLVKIGEFNLKLDKYLTRVVEQGSKGTKIYTYAEEKFGKIEIDRKTINGTNLVVEYTIRVTNIGEVDAYVRNIADYIPEGFEFKSELNKDWYQQNGTIYSKSLANEKIKAGESKDLTLVLTKSLTNDTVATTYTNTAEIAEVYNELGTNDINSTPGNKVQGEDDLSKADLLISISTGREIMYIGLTISMIAIIAVGIYLIKKKVLDVRN